MQGKYGLIQERQTFVSTFCNNDYYLIFNPSHPAANIEPTPLKLVHIYFDTATFDEIEKDVKVTLEAQLGLVGGTMGLLTGFSILSGVEIIYFAIKLFTRIAKKRVQRGAK